MSAAQSGSGLPLAWLRHLSFRHPRAEARGAYKVPPKRKGDGVVRCFNSSLRALGCSRGSQVGSSHPAFQRPDGRAPRAVRIRCVRRLEQLQGPAPGGAALTGGEGEAYAGGHFWTKRPQGNMCHVRKQHNIHKTNNRTKTQKLPEVIVISMEFYTGSLARKQKATGNYAIPGTLKGGLGKRS